MEYQTIVNFLDNTSSQPSKFRTRNWAEVNNDSRGTCNTNSQIKFKFTILKSSLCDYRDTYIRVKRIIVTTEEGVDYGSNRLDERNKRAIFKNCTPFFDCISKINSTQIDNAKDLDIVMLLYNLIECTGNCSTTSECLWQYC